MVTWSPLTVPHTCSRALPELKNSWNLPSLRLIGPSNSQFPGPVTGAENVSSSAEAGRALSPAHADASNDARNANRLNMIRPHPPATCPAARVRPTDGEEI